MGNRRRKLVLGRFRLGMLAAGAATALALGLADPSRGQEPEPAAMPPILGPTSHPQGFEYGVYQPTFAVDQRAWVAVRCLSLVRGSESRRDETTARFSFEIDNRTKEELEMLPDELFLDWAKEHRVPRYGRIEKSRIEGTTELEPGKTARIRVSFPLGVSVSPLEVHVMRIRFALRSDLGARVLLRSVFVRDRPGPDARFLFVPFFDPFGGVGILPRGPFP